MRDFKEEIDKALDILFKLERQSCKTDDLLGNGKVVYLQISLFKIPYVPRRKRRFLNLCHSLYGEDPEICLFVPNRKSGVEYKKTTEEFIDFCVDHYTELLEKHRVRGIKTVMPVKQLRSEYGAYELRRKLVQRFDIFLCKNSLLYNPRFLTALGKIFRVANKEPFGIAFPKENVEYDPDFDKNVQRAIFTSSFFIQPYSDNYSIPIGTLSNSKPELKDNLTTVLDQLFSDNLIPGGFQNIRAMNIWPSQSNSIPLYVSTELPEDLKQPRLRSRRKGIKSITGELSTQPGKKVTVSSSGDVFVSNIHDDSEQHQSEMESDDESIDEGSDEGEEDLGVNAKPRAGPQVNAGVGTESGNESESEDDEEIEEREQRLLKVKRQAEREYFNELKKPRKAEVEDLVEEKNNQNGIKKNLKKEKEFKTATKCLKEEKTNGKNKGKMNKSKRKMLVKEEKMAKMEKAKQRKMTSKLKPKAKF